MKTMTFSDFGLNIECNVFADVTDNTISNGIEYAANMIKVNSIVFVVDIDMNTVCFTKKETDEKPEGITYMTGQYIDATDHYARKQTRDYKIVGAWMMDMIHEQDVDYYGVIVENPDGSYQVLNR